MAEYLSEKAYIESATTIEGQIVKIDAIIDGLFAAALTAATTGHIESYSLDTGQSKINTAYKDLDSIRASIQNYMHLKQICIQRINNNCGRVVRLVDSNSIKN
jgi:hypothetical protein